MPITWGCSHQTFWHSGGPVCAHLSVRSSTRPRSLGYNPTKEIPISFTRCTLSIAVTYCLDRQIGSHPFFFWHVAWFLYQMSLFYTCPLHLDFSAAMKSKFCWILLNRMQWPPPYHSCLPEILTTIWTHLTVQVVTKVWRQLAAVWAWWQIAWPPTIKDNVTQYPGQLRKKHCLKFATHIFITAAVIGMNWNTVYLLHIVSVWYCESQIP